MSVVRLLQIVPVLVSCSLAQDETPPALLAEPRHVVIEILSASDFSAFLRSMEDVYSTRSVRNLKLWAVPGEKGIAQISDGTVVSIEVESVEEEYSPRFGNMLNVDCRVQLRDATGRVLPAVGRIKTQRGDVPLNEEPSEWVHFGQYGIQFSVFWLVHVGVRDAVAVAMSPREDFEPRRE